MYIETDFKQNRQPSKAKWHTDETLKVMEKGVYSKFSQNKHPLFALLATGENRLVESSPRDLVWGSGLPMLHPKATEFSRWKGKNKLGDILEYVHSALKSSS